MVGRKVKSTWGRTGEVVKWEPLGAGMTDTLVQHDDGLCWHASHSLKPIDDLGPLPSRREAQEAARVQALDSLRAIRADHVANFNKPWPGCEHGKAILGRAIDGAIKELSR